MVKKKNTKAITIKPTVLEAILKLAKQRRIWAALAAAGLLGLSIYNGEIAESVASGLAIALSVWSYVKPKSE